MDHRSSFVPAPVPVRVEWNESDVEAADDLSCNSWFVLMDHFPNLIRDSASLIDPLHRVTDDSWSDECDPDHHEVLVSKDEVSVFRLKLLLTGIVILEEVL